MDKLSKVAVQGKRLHTYSCRKEVHLTTYWTTLTNAYVCSVLPPDKAVTYIHFISGADSSLQAFETEVSRQ